MGVVYTKKDQGNSITSGTGTPSHSGIAGDRYTDTVTGYNYIYTTSWQQVIAGGVGGVCGIANTSGIYTYYSTLSAAMTAATSGQTVDLLTDVTETGSVTITLKAGVKINGNGYTYTLNVNDNTHTLTQNGGGAVYLYNSYATSTSSPVTARANIYNSTVRCLWNNVGGSCTNSFVVGSHEVMNSFLEVSNASAYCITGYVGSTWKYGGNSFKGATTPINTTNISQALTNTQDNQGNILM